MSPCVDLFFSYLLSLLPELYSTNRMVYYVSFINLFSTPAGCLSYKKKGLFSSKCKNCEQPKIQCVAWLAEQRRKAYAAQGAGI